MGKISGDDSKVPTYKQEYQEGVDLFDKSFKEYMKSQEPHQKAKFKDVMDKALDVMNKAAMQALSEEQKKLNENVHKDYDAFMKSPGQKSGAKLEKDVEDLKKSI